MKIRLTFLSLFFYFSQYSFSQELCPPASIDIFGGDQQNIVSWGEPVGNIGCGDYAINELPFTAQGNNTGTGDNWPVSGSQGDDVAYTLNVGQATTFDFTLCSMVTDYDTKLEIFTNDQDCAVPTSTGNYNDDDYTNCADYQAPYPPSGLFGVTLQPGQYYVVVDGYGGATGNYELSVSVVGARQNNILANSVKTAWLAEQQKMVETGFTQNEIDVYTEIVMDPQRYSLQNSSREIPAECGTFATYEVYDAVTNTLLTSTTGLSFTHSDLTNGIEYCYYVKTVYDEGSSEATDTGCGTPNSWEPAPPTNVYAEVWDEEVSLYWTAPEVNNLGVPYTESFDEGGLLDLWLVDGGDNWLYDEATGNPAPSMIFNWSPSVENYSQSLYAPVIPLGALTSVTVSFDYELNIWSPSGAEFFSIEYKTGSDADWTVLELFDNSGDSFDFTNYSYDLTGLSGNLFFRFHAYGANSFDLNWHRVDNFSVSSPGRDARNEYDFLGYNVYVDGTINNSTVFDSTNYTVYELNNELQYVFGVSAVYEGAAGEVNYESAPVNVSAQPVYVYGDVTGLVRDPNGAVLDSVIVTAGNASDTTGADGVYYLWNLDVGVNTVQVRRSGFYTATEDVEVLAQADPTLQDFVMSPDMPSPVGLNAYPLDEEVHLEWREPGGASVYDMAYYDDNFEAQIGCGAPCSFSVRFTPPNYPALLTGMVLSFQGGGTAVAASVDVYFDPSGSVGGPVGEPINLVPSADLSAPAELVQYQFDVSGAGVEVSSGDIYIVVNEAGSGFLGISNDTEPQSPEHYDRNWVTTDGVTWATIFDVVAGDPGLTGDFGILAQFLGAPGMTYAMDASGDIVEDEVAVSGVISNFNDNDIEIDRETIQPDNMTVLNGTYQPMNPTPSNMDRDDLVEYRVYEVDLQGNETFVVATTDTFATVAASPNYLEYCYNVSAFWNTDNYGQLESRHSNVACAVPYAFGDADFDSDTDINDVLAVVDFILEEDFPTEDEFRNVDVNMDEEINIADVVMIVDLIYGGNARLMNFDENEIAFVDMLIDYKNSNLLIAIEYQGPIRGLEIELEYDSDMVEILSASLSKTQEDVMIATNQLDQDRLKVLVANLNSGSIDSEDNKYITIPLSFKGNEQQASTVSLKDIKIAGADGNIARSLLREGSSEIKAVPSSFALMQNFPNPFNPTTEIRFDIPESDFVSIGVYNMMGQKIRTLTSGNMTPGYHSVIWDGKNDLGSQVSTGMYFYSIHSGMYKSTKKMLFLK